ncbi:hypothetical protein TEA_028832 [Camellia sinensis var. sinensis]|uniref:F-box domain-containing protein n=1 Tax=Camellia sinensis var. sinensis TaxID=542762 RepID=A0A4S4E6P1_CAMSN|nr:hypothetical protein TEA_028832 [Camellia sinensis var. sinensis]
MADASTAKRNPNPSSSETVANNDDLLNQILLYLPIRSLLRFKSVSKHWLSLITNPHFLHLRTTHPNPRPSGLFLYRYSHQIHPDFDFLSLLNYESPSKPPFKALTFVHDPSDLRILQSCNGLLLCRGLHLYIYNPTTSQFATLPQPPRRVLTPLRCFTTFYAYNLAFDPSKSPHYKVVSVNFSCGLPDHYELEIYSSETGLWSPSGDPFTGDVSFNLGVFWNGALHWISTSGGDSLYFNVDKERLETMPMPPIPDGWEERRLRYFRESRDHLHLIEIYGPHTTQFNVYEMERDYCGWFVKYRVDIDAIPNAFPEMIHSSLDPSDLYYYQFVILDLIREENDEESFLVLHIPGKVIRYNFRDKSFRELFDVPRCPDNECFSFEDLKKERERERESALDEFRVYGKEPANVALNCNPPLDVAALAPPTLLTERDQEESHDGAYGKVAELSIRGDSLRFDVDKECLQIMLMPPLPSGYNRRDDSNQNNCRALEFLQLCYTFGCRRETTDGGESSFMVLHINGKVMRYSFEDKSLKKLCDFAASAPGRPQESFNLLTILPQKRDSALLTQIRRRIASLMLEKRESGRGSVFFSSSRSVFPSSLDLMTRLL